MRITSEVELMFELVKSNKYHLQHTLITQIQRNEICTILINYAITF